MQKAKPDFKVIKELEEPKIKVIKLQIALSIAKKNNDEKAIKNFEDRIAVIFKEFPELPEYLASIRRAQRAFKHEYPETEHMSCEPLEAKKIDFFESKKVKVNGSMKKIISLIKLFGFSLFSFNIQLGYWYNGGFTIFKVFLDTYMWGSLFEIYWHKDKSRRKFDLLYFQLFKSFKYHIK